MKKTILCVLFCFTFFGPALFAGSSPVELDPADYYLAGPTVITDEFNGFSLDLPEGWYATVPMPVEGTGYALTTISNYDVNRVDELIPAPYTHQMLKSMVKADIFVRKLGGRETVAQWAGTHTFELAAGYDAHGEEMMNPGIPVSRIISYRLAERLGSAYVLAPPGTSAVEIALPWKRNNQMLFVNVHQGDSDALADALVVLDTVRPAGKERALVPWKSDKSRLVAPILNLVAEDLPLMKARSIEQKGACTSWTGSDAGSGANKAPVAYFPFQYNQYWQAGNAGSFWGNYYHGNCNNDYYAVDFNYRGTGQCSGGSGSAGRTLYAVFSGSATVGYDSTGYGYYVKLASGTYEVLYAHLQQANRFSGSATANVTVIGYTGDSGSAAGAPHLHLRIRKDGTAYCNYTAGCPNGEAKKSPQGYAYKNMWTTNSRYPNAGSSMFDGACYGGHP